jgi:hypothetical protein
MVSRSWRHWLSSTLFTDVPCSRRRVHGTRGTQVEALEGRAMLSSAPVVVNGSASPQEDQVFPGSVAGLGFDVDLDPLTYSVVTSTTHGTIVMAASGSFVYTPTANFNGVDTFTFIANDGALNSNVGTFTLTVSPVDAGLKLTLPSAVIPIARNSTPFRIDPAATVGDADTVIDYSNATIRTTIYKGNSAKDVTNSRVILNVRSEPAGVNTVTVKGTKIYFNGDSSANLVGKFSGGTKGSSLIVTFSNGVTEEAVNAVLQRISIQASKKANKGARNITITVSADGQRASASKVLTIV